MNTEGSPITPNQQPSSIPSRTPARSSTATGRSGNHVRRATTRPIRARIPMSEDGITPAPVQPERVTTRYWTDEEHQKYLIAGARYGFKNQKKISEAVGTRDKVQTRTHTQKFFMKIMTQTARSFAEDDLLHLHKDQRELEVQKIKAQSKVDKRANLHLLSIVADTIGDTLLYVHQNPAPEEQIVNNNVGASAGDEAALLLGLKNDQ